MKLNFVRLAIVSLLAVCLLSIVGTQVTNLFNQQTATSTSPRQSEAIGTDRFRLTWNGKFGYIDLVKLLFLLDMQKLGILVKV
jgi:hypothetical protein